MTRKGWLLFISMSVVWGIPYLFIKHAISNEKKPSPSLTRRLMRAMILLDEDGLQRAYTPLRESVQVIKQKHDLDAEWFNYLAQMLMYDEVIAPDGKLWKRFGPLHVYAPTREYILALKITAGRKKDLADCAILLSKTRIRTREQAQQVVERYLLPDGLEKYAESIEHALRWLFEGKRG